MMRIRRFRAPAIVPAVLLATAVSACGDPFAIPPASLPTNERLVTLYAMTGTPVSQPSAFNLLNGVEVRTDRSPDFDFVVEFAPDSVWRLGTTGTTVIALIPRGALGFAPDGGLQVSSVAWDSLTLAPAAGYARDHAIRVDSGSVVVGASRGQTCNFGLVRPLYAKFRLESVDWVNRSITARMVTDPNCGYRGLGPGVPAA